MISDSQWGYVNKTKWALYQRAPFTASGLNEILATSQYRPTLLNVANSMGLRLNIKSGYAITQLRNLVKEEESNG